MKTSSTAAPPKRSTAVNCAIINQLATPGLGSLMARRYVAGAVQLLLALIGFVLCVGWFILHTYALISDPPAPDRFPWMGWAGAAIFLASWLLAWPTTISVLRAARKAGAEKPPVQRIPPKLSS